MEDSGQEARLSRLSPYPFRRPRSSALCRPIMTPHEKAVAAVNARIERLQAELHGAKAEGAQRFLIQAIVVTVSAAEALNDYARAVGQFAQRRHAQVKQANETLTTQHAELLKSGQILLEQLKASPTDKALRKEIERTQSAMAAVQNTVRRGANALQRDLAPGLALLDEMAGALRRLSEAEQADALKRGLKAIVGHVRELYAAQSGVRGKDLVDAPVWEKSILAEVDQAAGFHDAYARAGYQAILALELMTLAVAENPPETAGEAARRAQEAVAVRLKAVTARLAM